MFTWNVPIFHLLYTDNFVIRRFDGRFKRFVGNVFVHRNVRGAGFTAGNCACNTVDTFECFFYVLLAVRTHHAFDFKHFSHRITFLIDKIIFKTFFALFFILTFRLIFRKRKIGGGFAFYIALSVFYVEQVQAERVCNHAKT